MRKYTHIFANSDHVPLTKIDQLTRYGDNSLSLFCNKKLIGRGYLCRQGRRRVLQTSGTKILDKFRRKGHGIQLYIALVETARDLGARRIKSDTALNPLSEKMWRDKLSKVYPVKVKRTKKPCYECQRPGLRREYYYIDL